MPQVMPARVVRLAPTHQPRGQPAWISVSRYAAVYGVSRATVYKWIAADLLERYRVDGVLRIKDVPPDQHRTRCL